MTQPSGNDLLMGGGRSRSASFDGQFPITVEGIVVEPPGVTQELDFDTREPKWWDDAKTQPKLMTVIKVQTDHRVDDEDDGVRTFFAKFKMRDAIRDAVKATGAKGVLPGGWLSVTYYADEPKKQGHRGKPVKLYSAQYVPPDPGNDVLMAVGTESAVVATAQQARFAAPPTPPGAALAAQQSAVLARLAARQPAYSNHQGGAQTVEPPF